MTNPIKLFRLPIGEQLFFSKAVFFLLCSRIVITFIPLKNILEKISLRSTKLPQRKHKGLDVNRIAYLIRAAAALVPFSTCLSKSLAGFFLFDSQGYRAEFHIGVSKKKSQDFKAHAWLTLGGATILGSLPDLEKYKELPLATYLQGPQ